MSIDTDILVKLLVSALLGLIIGLEREFKRKPVGLKTSLVICIVSCLLTCVSIKSAYTFVGNDLINVTMDPLRLAAQIVSGVGFIGAGVILRRHNNSISGLTTAAIIWGAAGIGIAIGAGFYLEAIMGVVLLMICVELVPWIMTKLLPKHLGQQEFLVKLRVVDKNSISFILETLRLQRFTIRNIRIKDVEDQNHAVTLRIVVGQHWTITEIYYVLSMLEEITHVEIED